MKYTNDDILLVRNEFKHDFFRHINHVNDGALNIFEKRKLAQGCYSSIRYQPKYVEGFRQLNIDRGSVSVPAAIYEMSGYFSDYDFFSDFPPDTISNAEKNERYLKWITLVSFVSEIFIYGWLVKANLGRPLNRFYNIFYINDYMINSAGLAVDIFNIIDHNLKNENDNFYKYAEQSIKEGINIYRNFP